MRILNLAAKYDENRGRTVIYDILTGEALFEATEECSDICDPEVLAKLVVDPISNTYKVHSESDIRQEYFEVKAICREDLDNDYRDMDRVRALTNDEMADIADKMSDGMGDCYWEALSYVIEEYYPELEGEDEPDDFEEEPF